MLYKLFHDSNCSKRELKTTRYEIAKNTFFNTKHIGKTDYNRIIKSLKKWNGVAIKFEGIFYEGNNYTFRLFHVIDNVILDQATQELVIQFNEQYIQLLQESKFYKYIDFNAYKKLTKSLSARLYEILIKTFKDRNSWSIDIQSLAEKLTLEKRPQAKAYYPSDVLIKLRPAVKEISEKTELCVTLQFNKETSTCLFKNSKRQEKQEVAVQAATVSTTQEQPITEIISTLVSYGVSSKQAQVLAQKHSADKITHKIALLQRGTKTIKNVTAWLMQALEQDWNAQEHSKHQEAQRQEAERLRKYKEQELAQKREKKLRLEFEEYQCVKAQSMYDALSPELKKLVNAQLNAWVDQQAKTIGLPLKIEDYFISFIVNNLLPKEDLDFKVWAAKQN